MAGLARFRGVVIALARSRYAKPNQPKRPIPWSLPPGNEVEVRVSEFSTVLRARTFAPLETFRLLII